MNDKPVYMSKRFVSTIVLSIVMLLVYFIPELKPYAEKLTEHLTNIAMLLIGGYTTTDVARMYLNKTVPEIKDEAQG